MKRRVFSATAWDLTETFFEAMREYRQIYFLYESQVMAHAEEQAVNRNQLRLNATEVSKLLDFSRLMNLRNGALFRAKDISHRLFRSEGRTTKFDRYISEIFHELSILREEQYKVSTFAEEYRRENAIAEYESLLDEVHEDFPRRVNSIHELFKKAQRSLEIVLRARRHDPVYLRSLVLFGDATVGDAYPEGVSGHAWAVFERGPAEAFYWASRSFACRGFKKEALGAIERAQDFCSNTYREIDLKDLIRDLDAFHTYVSERSPVELVQSMVDEAKEPLYADDTAVATEPDESEPVTQS